MPGLTYIRPGASGTEVAEIARGGIETARAGQARASQITGFVDTGAPLWQRLVLWGTPVLALPAAAASVISESELRPMRTQLQAELDDAASLLAVYAEMADEYGAQECGSAVVDGVRRALTVVAQSSAGAVAAADTVTRAKAEYVDTVTDPVKYGRAAEELVTAPFKAAAKWYDAFTSSIGLYVVLAVVLLALIGAAVVVIGRKA